jgi:hypothetical protein
MAKSAPNIPAGVNRAAPPVTEPLTVETKKKKEKPKVPVAVSRVMSAMGRRGGLIGGKRRMVTMTAEERKAVASKAAKARWARRKN